MSIVACVMQYPQQPEDKSSNSSKDARASLALRISRAANDLNPVLVVMAIGLLVLNITLYLGMSVTRQPSVWAATHQSGGLVAPANAASGLADGGSPASAARN